MKIFDGKIKKWHFAVLIIICVTFIVLKLFNLLYWPKGTVVIGGRSYAVLVASNLGHQHKGWSDADNTGSVDGMWFYYGAPSYHTMVMRDMKFPLDIIWVKDGVIVDIAPSLQPEPGKTESELTRYRSRLPSTDVLEFKAGFSAQNGLKIGDQVILQH